jgi:hypothetical protein
VVKGSYEWMEAGIIPALAADAGPLVPDGENEDGKPGKAKRPADGDGTKKELGASP